MVGKCNVASATYTLQIWITASSYKYKYSDGQVTFYRSAFGNFTSCHPASTQPAPAWLGPSNSDSAVSVCIKIQSFYEHAPLLKFIIITIFF